MRRFRYDTFSIQDMSRRSGLSEPTLRYYEEVGLIGPIARDASSGHRRYAHKDLNTLQALACLRAMGVGIEDMRTYQANLARRHEPAAEQRDLLLRHAERIEAEIAAQHARLDYLREKAALWDARDRGDTAAETEAMQRGRRRGAAALRRAAMSPVLVTGGSGYVGTQLIAALLRAGSPVRTTVRSQAAEAELRAAVRRGDADDAGLEIVAADLMTDDGGPPPWPAAKRSITSRRLSRPSSPTDPDELIVPAREGALRVLRAARDAGARRVVLTSSFAAIGYTPKPGAEFTEDDWTDPDTPGLAPYPRSKAIAERAAWDLMERDGGDTELVVVNPTFILGPTLTTDLRSSTQLIKAMLDGTMTVAPRARFGVADVRDVADLHLRAMAAPEAAGKRFLAVADGPTTSYLEVADILRRRLGPWRRRCRPRRRRGPICRGRSSTTTGPATSSAGGPRRRDDDRGVGREPARPGPPGVRGP